MPRLPSIARSIQEMCQDQVAILRRKQLDGGVDGLEPKDVMLLEVLARINATNIKADPQVKPARDRDAAGRVPEARARASFETLDSLAPRRTVDDENDADA